MDIKNIWSEIASSGHLATRVLVTLVVTTGFTSAIWTAKEKYDSKADVAYVKNTIADAKADVDARLEVAMSERKVNKEKSNYIIRKSLEAQTERRALLQEKIRRGEGTKFDAETIKYLNQDIKRLQDLLEK